MFWRLPHHGARSTLWVYQDIITTADDFLQQCTRFETRLKTFNRKTLGMIACSNHPAAITAYLASLRSGHAVMLIGPDLNAALRDALIEQYKPDWYFSASDSNPTGYDKHEPFMGWFWQICNYNQNSHALHPDLALLLSTSGSTGSPKMVRLSYKNLASNAESIAQYLGLTAKDRAITSLPMAYSYGLSVINSLLQAGGSLCLTDASLMQPDFWIAMQQDITHLAGVAPQYHMLRRLKLETRAPESLRLLTQAGGKLDAQTVLHFANLANEQRWKFFVMYGQTEATARMAYMPPEHLAAHPDCIGVSIPNGKLSADEETGEIIYEGPNVMMGYAENRADLSKGDENNGILRTGDIGILNDKGYWQITGRLKRFIKLAGQRIQLDQIEKFLPETFSFPFLCTGEDEHLAIWVKAPEEKTLANAISEAIFERFNIHPTLMSVYFIDEIPLNSNGKINYQQLRAGSSA